MTSGTHMTSWPEQGLFYLQLYLHFTFLPSFLPSFLLLSFYWASVANAPNVLQPYWLIVLSLDVPDLTVSLLLWGPSGQRWELQGRENGRWILPENVRLPRNIQGSSTCRKSTTWDRRLYSPSEGRRTEDSFALKNPTASVGFEPANLGTKGQQATSIPPRPHLLSFLLM